MVARRNRVVRDGLKAAAAGGLTGAMILVPQGMAIATIAGIPPKDGLGSDPMDTIEPRLDGAVCTICTRQTFTQCAAQAGGTAATATGQPIVLERA